MPTAHARDVDAVTSGLYGRLDPRLDGADYENVCPKFTFFLKHRMNVLLPLGTKNIFYIMASSRDTRFDHIKLGRLRKRCG
jgi:hypothetical protein